MKMLNRQELQELWGLDEAEWNKMATSCGINPEKTQLNEFEFNRLDKAQQLLNEQRVNSHEEITTFFANNAAKYPLTDTMGNGSSTSPAPEEGKGSAKNGAVSESQLALTEGEYVAETYVELVKQAAERKVVQIMESGEFHQDLTRRLKSAFRQNDLAAQMRAYANKRFEEMKFAAYDPQSQVLAPEEEQKMLDHSYARANEPKIIEGEFDDNSSVNRECSAEDNAPFDSSPSAEEIAEDSPEETKFS